MENAYAPALSTPNTSRDPASGFGSKIYWSSDDVSASPPIVDYNRVMKGDRGVYDWLRLIYTYGFAFVKGCPPTPEATEALIRRIAFIRETHYGGFWDFTADLAHGDTAYTNIELGAHTDTT
jgi:trimethyllysine dioxygenase